MRKTLILIAVCFWLSSYGQPRSAQFNPYKIYHKLVDWTSGVKDLSTGETIKFPKVPEVETAVAALNKKFDTVKFSTYVYTLPVAIAVERMYSLEAYTLKEALEVVDVVTSANPTVLTQDRNIVLFQIDRRMYCFSIFWSTEFNGWRIRPFSVDAMSTSKQNMIAPGTMIFTKP
jgi:hypothetical protein